MSDIFIEKLRNKAKPKAMEKLKREEFLQEFQKTTVELLKDIVNVSAEYHVLSENDIYEWVKLLQEQLKTTFPSKRFVCVKPASIEKYPFNLGLEAIVVSSCI